MGSYQIIRMLNTILFSPRDMIWTFVTVQAIRTAQYKFTSLLTYLRETQNNLS